MADSFKIARGRLRKNKVAKKLLNQQKLPVLPEILDKLESVLANRDGDAAKVAKLVETEPVIAGRLVKVANSVLLGGRSKVTDMQLAVSRLGVNRIRQVVYSLVLPQLFIDIHMVDHHQFWKHSLATATIARKLAVNLHESPEIGDTAYMAGLVHDIGVLLMAMGMTDEYTEIIQTAYAEGRPLSEVEYEELEMTHVELGAIFVHEKWQFAEEISEAILMHEYAPELKPRNTMAEALYVADHVCIAAGLTNGALGDPTIQYPEPLKYLSQMGYNEPTQEKLVEVVKELATSLDSYLG